MKPKWVCYSIFCSAVEVVFIHPDYAYYVIWASAQSKLLEYLRGDKESNYPFVSGKMSVLGLILTPFLYLRSLQALFPFWKLSTLTYSRCTDECKNYKTVSGFYMVIKTLLLTFNINFSELFILVIGPFTAVSWENIESNLPNIASFCIQYGYPLYTIDLLPALELLIPFANLGTWGTFNQPWTFRYNLPTLEL